MKSWEVTELTALGIAFMGSGSTKLNVHANDTAGLPAKQLYKKLLISGRVTELGETRTLISPTGGAAVVAKCTSIHNINECSSRFAMWSCHLYFRCSVHYG